MRITNQSIAASVFNQSPADFDAVSGPLEILLGHVQPSIFLVTGDSIGENRLY